MNKISNAPDDFLCAGDVLRFKKDYPDVHNKPFTNITLSDRFWNLKSGTLAVVVKPIIEVDSARLVAKYKAQVLDCTGKIVLLSFGNRFNDYLEENFDVIYKSKLK